MHSGLVHWSLLSVDGCLNHSVILHSVALFSATCFFAAFDKIHCLRLIISDNIDGRKQTWSRHQQNHTTLRKHTSCGPPREKYPTREAAPRKHTSRGPPRKPHPNWVAHIMWATREQGIHSHPAGVAHIMWATREQGIHSHPAGEAHIMRATREQGIHSHPAGEAHIIYGHLENKESIHTPLGKHTSYTGHLQNHTGEQHHTPRHGPPIEVHGNPTTPLESTHHAGQKGNCDCRLPRKPTTPEKHTSCRPPCKPTPHRGFTHHSTHHCWPHVVYYTTPGKHASCRPARPPTNKVTTPHYGSTYHCEPLWNHNMPRRRSTHHVGHSGNHTTPHHTGEAHHVDCQGHRPTKKPQDQHANKLLLLYYHTLNGRKVYYVSWSKEETKFIQIGRRMGRPVILGLSGSRCNYYNTYSTCR